MNNKKIFCRNRVASLINVALFFYISLSSTLVIAQSSNLSKKYLELKKMKEAGASLIGELEYELTPGWWQYAPSCERSKWISFSQKFKAREDSKASCDQQIHDYKAVVAPTLSKSTEFSIPKNGNIVVFSEIQDKKGYEKEPFIYVSLHHSDGSVSNMSHSILNNATQSKSPENYQAKKDDKVIIKIEARARSGAGRGYLYPIEAKVQVYLIPDDPTSGKAEKPKGNIIGQLYALRGFVTVLSGGVTTVVRPENGPFPLASGSTVTTSANGLMRYIADDDAAEIRQGGNTTMVIRLYQVYLKDGRLWLDFHRKGRKWEHTSPHAYISIRGTELFLDVRPKGTSIYMIENMASFADRDRKKTVKVPSGFTSTCRPGGVPTNPIRFVDADGDGYPDNQGKWWLLPDEPGKIDDKKNKDIVRLRPIADSHVYAYSYSNWNKANWGKYNILGAGWHPTGGEKRVYLKFDLAGVDPISVGKATLKLFHYHTGGGNSLNVGVHRVKGPWIEGRGTYKPATIASPGEISWVNQPSFDPYPIVQFNPGLGVNKWVEVDITPLVKSWLSGAPNNGLMIKPEGNLSGGTPEAQYGFRSREFGDTAKRPVLVLSGSGSVEQPGSGSDNNKEISASFTIPPRSGSYAWEHTEMLTIPGSSAVVFDAKATNDIHVCFAETASDRSPLYEVVIGGWNNTQTVIRKGRQNPHQGHARVNVKQNPQAVVAANHWATYWVSVNKGLVLVGRGEIVGQNITLKWQDPDPLQHLKDIAFSTWNTPVEFRNIRLRSVGY